jgi:hypothetical protein
VVGFLGGAAAEDEPGTVFPLAHYDMTPNMVAGTLTTTYEGGGSTDSLVVAPTGGKAPLNCAQLVGCNAKTEAEFNAFYMLNPEPTGVEQPGAIGSFFSNTAAGTNYQLSNWMCSAPNAPFELTVPKKTGTVQEPVTDINNTATGTLTTPPTQSPFWDPTTNPDLWPFKTCTPTSQFPTLSAGSLSQYQPADTPALQAKSIRAYGASGNLAFGSMDWSEALFSGLNVAALQNASGAFVTPSAASVLAAFNDAKVQPDGTYTFNYDDTGDATAYPMPMVTYAVIPTAGVPASQAQAVTTFLTDMVTYSSGADGTLPGGYVPLPAAVVKTAIQDIAQDVKAAPPATSTGTTGTTGTTTTTTGTTSSAGGTTPTDDDSGDLGSDIDGFPIGTTGPTGLVYATGSTNTTSSTPQSPAAKTKPSAKPAPPKSVIAADFSVIVGGTRYLIPVLLVLAAAAVILGPALLAWPRRRRPVPAGGPGSSSEGGER